MRTILFWSAVMTGITICAWGVQSKDRLLFSTGVRLSTNADELLELIPLNDPVHYLAAARNLAAGKPMTAKYRRYWQAGPAFVIMAATEIGSPHAYPLTMALAASLFWGIALGLAVCLFSPWRLAPVGAVAAGTLWLFGAQRDWIFGYGALMSDSLAAAVLLSGIVLMFAALVHVRMSYFIWAGIALGLAANFRYQNLVMTRVVLVVLLLCVILMMWRRGLGPKRVWTDLRRGRREEHRDHAGRLAATFKGLLAAIAVFAASLVPWTVLKTVVDGTATWYKASNEMKYGPIWKTDEETPNWMHAANAQCNANPELCAELNARWGEGGAHFFDELLPLAITTTVTHPLEVARYKLADSCYLWWGASWETLRRDWQRLVGGIVLLLAGLSAALLLIVGVRRSTHPGLTIALVAGTAFLVLNTAVFTLFHFEWRYALPLRVLCAVGPWLVFGALQQLGALPTWLTPGSTDPEKTA